MITVDERRMRQILINLLSNAVKFTPAQGRVQLKVEVMSLPLVRDAHLYQTNGAIANINPAASSGQIHEIWFTVSDTGIGIAESDLDKLFQPFVQIDSNLNRQYPGTGLGLNLVKRLTELHGGHVSVSSQIQQGSDFVVKIPLLSS
jgi:signal transduction histidine kinase